MGVKTKIFAFLLLLFIYKNTFAQGEADNWYFGENAGVNFSTGVPVILTDGQLSTLEGCATISNSNGELLFYTDGITVWDKNHNVMPNGNGLLGDPSSSQSAIIVPKPSSSGIYYVFTVAANAGTGGLRYSELDMSLNNGNGDITAVKNILLQAPVTEKISAIEHANGTDYWVVTHDWGNADFLSYEVTASGVSSTPIISTVGNIHSGDDSETIGYLKVSPNGERLALASWSNNSFAEIFDFNDSTGSVSNSILLDNIFYTGISDGVYGIEFSIDSKLLYTSDVSFTSIESKIHQFDISLATSADVMNSDQILFQGNELIGAIQLSVDGKIYLANGGQPFLDVIENPNVFGAGANYLNKEVDLNGKVCNFGLPPFIQSFFLADVSFQNTCLGDTTEFSIESNDPIESILWDFGDGSTSTEENPSHTYASAGNYSVSVVVNTTEESKNISIEVIISDVPVANQPTTNYLCDYLIDGLENFDLSINDSIILGSQLPSDYNITYHATQEDADNDLSVLVSPYNSGETTIFARIENSNNSSCYDTIFFDLKFFDILEVNLTPLEECDDDGDGYTEFTLTDKNEEVLAGLPTSLYTVTYYLNQTDAISGNNTLANLYTNVVINEQTIYVRLENNTTGCYETDSLIITMFDAPVINDDFIFYECDYNNQGDEVEQFYLAGLNDEIDNGANYELSYYSTLTDAEQITNALDDMYSNISNPQTIYVRAKDVDTSCYVISEMTLEVVEIPASASLELYSCDDDNDTFGWFNLEDATDEITGGDNTLVVTYYETIDQADLGASSGANIDTSVPYQNIDVTGDGLGITQTIYIRVESLLAGCYNIDETLTLNVVSSPYLPSEPLQYDICDEYDVIGDGFAQFDLTSYEESDLYATIIANAGGDVTAMNDYIATYYTALNAAGEPDPTTEIANPAAFENTVTPDQVIYVAVEHIGNSTVPATGCTTVAEITLHVDLVPNAVYTEGYICDTDGTDDGFMEFDLTSYITEITGGDTEVEVSFHLSLDDANNNDNSLTDQGEDITAYTNTVNPQPLYTRVYNATTGCYAVNLLVLHVDPLPTPLSSQDIIDQLGNAGVMEECDGNVDGSGALAEQIAEFDLTQWETLILTGGGPSIESGVSASYYTDYDEAVAQENAIATPNAFTNTSNPQTIYIRVTNDGTGIVPATDGSGCYVIVEFDVFVPVPQVTISGTDVLCVDENGLPLTTATLPVLTANVTPVSASYDYQWALDGVDIPGATNQSLTVTQAGEYTVTASGPTDFDCLNTASTTIELSGVPDDFNASVTTNAFADYHQIVATATSSIPGIEFFYTLDGEETNTSGIFNDVTIGEHTVTITDGEGCWEENITIMVIDYPKFFTPNGDGVNDTWQIVGIEGIPISQIYIFDRFGKLIHQLDPDSRGWDGTYNDSLMPAGDYWFKILYIEGATTPTAKEFKAHFSLKR